MRPIGCPEMPVRNYRYSLRNDPEERSYQDISLNIRSCNKLQN